MARVQPSSYSGESNTMKYVYALACFLFLAGVVVGLLFATGTFRDQPTYAPTPAPTFAPSPSPPAGRQLLRALHE